MASLNVYKNKLKVKITSAFVDIKGITSLEINSEKNTEDKFYYEDEGYGSTFATTISQSITLTLDKMTTDPGNKLLWANMFGLTDLEEDFELTLADGTVIAFTGLVLASKLGGETSKLDEIEVEIKFQGKPVITPAV